MTPTDGLDTLVKGFFLGQVDQQILFLFPELDSSETDVVSRLLSDWMQLASDKIDQVAIDRTQTIPETVMQAMRDMGLFGLTIPQRFGGLGLSTSAYGRIIDAVTAVCPALMLLIGAHLSIGLKGLLLYGNEEQQQRYLPSLATGKAIAAFALTEPQTGSDAHALHTRAVHDQGGWRMNGRKIWISNGDIASMITVFASTPEVDGEKPLTAFLVEPGLPGFSLGPSAAKLGLHGTNSVVLQFKDMHIPDQNVLGEPGEGFRIAVQVLNSGRIGLGAACVGAMKYCLRLASQWAQKRVAFGAKIAAYELIQDKVAQMALDIFVGESMVRLAGGMVDRGIKDYAVEAAATKAFCSEAMWRAADELVQIAGGRGYVQPFPYERVLRDSRINRIFEGTNEILRLLIFEEGTRGLRRSLRALSQSRWGMLKLATHKLQSLKQPALTGATDPRLADMAGTFRTTTARLSRDTTELLARHRANLAKRQLLVARVADMAIDTFGMAAVLSRLQSMSGDSENLSRALPIGRAYFHQAAARIEQNREALERNDDALRVDIAQVIYRADGYPL